eukprot:4326391-Amphidinium_carterae.2
MLSSTLQLGRKNTSDYKEHWASLLNTAGITAIAPRYNFQHIQRKKLGPNDPYNLTTIIGATIDYGKGQLTMQYGMTIPTTSLRADVSYVIFRGLDTITTNKLEGKKGYILNDMGSTILPIMITVIIQNIFCPHNESTRRLHPFLPENF